MTENEQQTIPARILNRIPFQVVYALLYVPAFVSLFVAAWWIGWAFRNIGNENQNSQTEAEVVEE